MSHILSHRSKDEQGAWDHSHTHPGFEGILEFELSISMLGRRVKRSARAIYKHTPEWEYYDLHKKALYVGWESTTLTLETQAVPDKDSIYSKDDPLAKGPAWVKLGDLIKDGVMFDKMWDSLYDAIDAKCKTEDAKRRRSASAKPSGYGLH